MITTAENGTSIADIEETCSNLPTNHVWRDFTIPEADYDKIRTMLLGLESGLAAGVPKKELFQMLQRKHHFAIKPSYFTRIYQEELIKGTMKQNDALEEVLVTSRCRGISGVSVVTVFLSPTPNGQTFSCKWNCHYCPNEPGQPRSYLFGEPGVLRANHNSFDCVKQMLTRIHTYRVNGHPTDKFEVLILGGTIHSYPKDYLETFLRDIFYAANVCLDAIPLRPAESLEAEKRRNREGRHRIIGITVETRPDCITPAELQDFRRWGVTRVQVGVQHTDDAILKKVNRGCLHKHTVAALKLLKDNCFKVDIHIMPNLPGATVAGDKAMIDVVLSDLQPDQVKVYPCETTPFTKILEDYKKGTYVPYDDAALEEVVLYWKTRVHPWIRNNRIVRDIPDTYIVAGVKSSSIRNDYQAIMKAKGLTCRCIRCREAGRHPEADPSAGVFRVRTFAAQGCLEHFLAWESVDEQVLFGFLRLRLPITERGNPVFPELTGAALIRELHVYGRTTAVGTGTGAVQHRGIGRTLLREAERMALELGYDKIAVISGVGVQEYYETRGYAVEPGQGEFLMKPLRTPIPWNEIGAVMLATVLVSSVIIGLWAIHSDLFIESHTTRYLFLFLF